MELLTCKEPGCGQKLIRAKGRDMWTCPAGHGKLAAITPDAIYKEWVEMLPQTERIWKELGMFAIPQHPGIWTYVARAGMKTPTKNGEMIARRRKGIGLFVRDLPTEEKLRALLDGTSPTADSAG